jgi:hypothetical protein
MPAAGPPQHPISGHMPLPGPFVPHPSHPHGPSAPTGPSAFAPQPLPLGQGQGGPQNLAFPPPPWATMPSAGVRHPLVIAGVTVTGQVIALVVVGIVCLTIFAVGIYLFVSTL